MKRVMLILVLLVMWGVGVPSLHAATVRPGDQMKPASGDIHDNGSQQVLDTYGATDDGTDGDPGDLGDGYGMTKDVGALIALGCNNSDLPWEEILWLLLVQLRIDLQF